MELALSETQQLVSDSIRDYLEREVPFSRVREVERGDGYDAKLWQGLHELGWLGLPFPEESGGSGGSILDLAVMVEELARRAVLIPIVEVMTAGHTLLRHGEKSVTDEILPRITSGAAIVVPALLEASNRFDDVRAGVDVDGRLSGEKYFVDYGQFASHHLVSATQNGEAALFLVDAKDAGVSFRPLRAIGRIPQAIVTYTNVPATRVCGAQGIAYLVQLARALTAVQCVGCAQQALNMTVEYVAMRVQFGRPIGTFQAVQHHAANMATMVESARFLVYEAVWAVQHDLATDKGVALAKACASRAATEVPMQAHQLHGGIGFIEEYDLYFFSLRGKQHALAWGSAEECLGIVAESIEEPEDWLQIRVAPELALAGA